MEVTVKGSSSKLALSDKTFDRPFSEALVHQVVNAYLAGGRAGTKATKSRSQVRGGGRKPWRQKGTGQARAGTIRSPLWRSGGHTFALTPRSFEQKVNRKQYRGALQAIMSELLRSQRLQLVKEFDIGEPKTKTLVAQLADYPTGRILIIGTDISRNLYLAARNVPRLHVIDTQAIDPVTLVGADHVIMTVDAAKKVEEWLG